ncbi:MAG: mechanosensitive ion channel family protein [Aliidongia sp.]
MRILSRALAVIAVISLWRLIRDQPDFSADMPDWARDNLPHALGVVFWLATASLVAALLRALILRHAQGRGGQGKLPVLLTDLSAVLVYFAAVLLIVALVFGRSLTGLLATSGVAAAIIGLAVQRTISDLLAGIALNVGQGGIKLGDWIGTPEGHVGQVREITWRATHLVMRDDTLLVVPNSSLVQNRFQNFSAPMPYFRVARQITVGYDAPPERVMLIFAAAMAATDGVLADPRAQVQIVECGSSGIVYTLNFWVLGYQQSFAIATAVTVSALKFLDQAGYSCPVQQMDVTLMKAQKRGIEHEIDRAAILHRVPLFRPFGAEAFALLERGAVQRNLPVGAEIVREGDEGRSLFVVVAGLFEVLRIASAGETRLARLGAGDVFGEMSLLTGAPRSATVRAMTDAVVLEIAKDTLDPVLALQPEAVEEMSRLQAERGANNLNALVFTPSEREEIERVGIAHFLRDKIVRFFALKPAAVLGGRPTESGLQRLRRPAED